MSSRAGIVGLAGLGLGVTTLATSKLVGAARGVGAKGLFRQIGTGIATLFKAIGKRFNPQLASKGYETNKGHTELHSKRTTKSLKKKIGKVESKFNSKNSFSYLKPITKREMKHNQKFSLQNLDAKQKRINEKLKDNLKKSDSRQKKLDEKTAQKEEKKKS